MLGLHALAAGFNIVENHPLTTVSLAHVIVVRKL